MNYRAARWKVRECRGFILLAKLWMLPGNWEGTIFSGLGLQGLRRGERCEAPGFLFPIDPKAPGSRY